MKILLKRFRKISYVILGIFFLGCSSDDGGAAKLPELVAGFTFTLNEDTGTATFKNTSTNATRYSWNFGDGNTSSEKDPIKTFETGTYTVVLTASNDAGASDTSEDEITVDVSTDPPGETTCDEETEQSLSAVDFNLTFQTDPTASIGSFDADLSWIDNPDIDNDVNSSCKVGQIDRTSANLFANNQIELDAKLDFNANGGFTMKVWSPVAGTNVMIKLEDKADAGTFIEIPVVTTLASAWEELTFPVASSESGKFDLIILFFEVNTDTVETYYIDDLALYACTVDCGGGPIDPPGEPGDNLAINGDFETGDTSGWDLSENNGLFETTDAEAACGTFSGHLVADVDAGTGGPSFPFVKQANIGVGTVTPNSQVTISFDLLGSVAGDGGVFIAEFFSETGTGGTSKSEILGGGPIFPTNNWTRYSYTVTTGNDVSAGVTLLLKSECGPVPGCGVDAYIDNVFIALGGTSAPDCEGVGSGGSGGGGTGGGGTGGTGGTGTGDEFTTNGDFETGDITGWTTFVDAAGASFEATNAQANGGSFSANLVSDFEAGNGGAVDAVVKQANIGVGTVTPNTAYVVSFDLRGSSGTGGDFFAEFFSELDTEGVSKAEILTGGPLTPTDNWVTYTFTVTTGNDVSGGITLQLKTSCGPVQGCVVDVNIDNVSVKLAAN